MHSIIYKRWGKENNEIRKGVHILDELIIEDTDEENGTFVHWKPDIEVFTDVNLTSKWVERLCKNLSYTAGFTVTFNNKGNITVYEKSDIFEQLKKEVGECSYSSTFHHEVDESGDVCICYSDIAVGVGGAGVSFFHNKVEISGGVHADSVNSALMDFFSERASERGIRVRSSDFSGKLSVIVSTLSNKVSYRGQTKDSLDNTYVYRGIYLNLKAMLDLEWSKGTSWLLDVVAEVIQNAENRIP